MDKLKKTLSGDDDEEQGIVTQISDATTLSWETRIKGFAICFILGVSLSVLGSCLLWIPNKGLILFACFYTIGNILSLASTCFLMGPVKQLKKMFAQTRIFATILVVVMLVLTLVCAIALKNPILTLMCCVVQFLALTWYSLSYIPFARFYVAMIVIAFNPLHAGKIVVCKNCCLLNVDAVKKCFEGCIS